MNSLRSSSDRAKTWTGFTPPAHCVRTSATLNSCLPDPCTQADTDSCTHLLTHMHEPLRSLFAYRYDHTAIDSLDKVLPHPHIDILPSSLSSHGVPSWSTSEIQSRVPKVLPLRSTPGHRSLEAKTRCIQQNVTQFCCLLVMWPWLNSLSFLTFPSPREGCYGGQQKMQPARKERSSGYGSVGSVYQIPRIT